MKVRACSYLVFGPNSTNLFSFEQYLFQGVTFRPVTGFTSEITLAVSFWRRRAGARQPEK
jgi:hypothetical protein